MADKGYDPSWFRVKNDNTNLYWYFSTDGINWSEFSNQAKTDFLANPNQIGFFSLPLYRAATLSINSFKIETTG